MRGHEGEVGEENHRFRLFPNPTLFSALTVGGALKTHGACTGLETCNGKDKKEGERDESACGWGKSGSKVQCVLELITGLWGLDFGVTGAIRGFGANHRSLFNDHYRSLVLGLHAFSKIIKCSNWKNCS